MARSRSRSTSRGRRRTARRTSRRASRSRQTRGRGSSSSSSSSFTRVVVNRAPLLLLWAAVVAQREGYKFTEGLSFGKAVAELCGRSKGRKIGLFKRKKGSKKRRGAGAGADAKLRRYDVFGMGIPGKIVKGHRYACKKGAILSHKSAHAYLRRSFGTNLSKVKSALRKLASRYPRADIGRRGYRLYEHFRPKVASGLKGWGAKGVLDLGKVQRLAKNARL